MNTKSFLAGLAAGVVLATVGAAVARVNVVGGVVGVTSGYGAATAVCVDANGEINHGSKIEPIVMPLGDHQGRVAQAVTFRCP
ncbi:hypothetical protein ACM64Y_09830 [Novispirillum sp. DQ9]|uniref:hypothetical protein n=1 Tax=Novispirillum sp. DQ9 TaxID=3398612 RepID=UPI003C7A39A9